MKARSLLCLLGCVALSDAWSVEPKPARITIFTRYVQNFQQAAEKFAQRFGPDLAHFEFLQDSFDCSALDASDMIFVHGRFWSPQMRACADVVRHAQARGALVGASTPALLEANWNVKGSSQLEQVGAYLDAGGDENLLHFLASLYKALRPESLLEIPPPEKPVEEGIYHPDAPRLFTSLRSYLDWYLQRHSVGADAGFVGITFFATAYRYGDMAHIDALIRALEKRGLGVVPVFCWPLRKAEPLLFLDGKPLVRLLLSLNLAMFNQDNVAWLESTGLRIINLVTTTETLDEWIRSERGIPAARLAVQIGTPERTGATEPVLIAVAESPGGKLQPVMDRIEAVAERTWRWVRLSKLPNNEKRIALVYYNNPPGKGSVGASYLDLFPSIVNIVGRLCKEGYRAGGQAPDAEQLRQLVLLAGRNAGEYAPGELESMVASGRVALWPVTEYLRFYRELPEPFRQAVEARWGAPASSSLMTVKRTDGLYFVIPGIVLDNLFLGPQPLRASYENAASTAHDRNTPPPHSYIAAYLWYKNVFKADAIVHLGRHGTLEWLPGKDVAQTGWDPGEVLVGNLPHLYFYVVDGGGEFLQVKRRSGGVLLSHLTPMLASAGIPPELQKLKDALANYRQTKEENPALAQTYLATIREEMSRLKLDKIVASGLAALSGEDLVGLAEQHLEDLAQQAIPLGLHAIGSEPPAQAVEEALRHFLRSGYAGQGAPEALEAVPGMVRALLDGEPIGDADEKTAKILVEARQWLDALRKSPKQELDSLVSALEGRYVPTGVSGDPLRTPAALPTGRNMHDTDPRTFPTPAAWQLGKRMAEKLIEDQRAKLGRYPEKVSLVLWYGESTRHQGVAEAQAMALLGVEPVWNGRGEVVDVKLIDAKELGRPRVDVILTISGLYRDGMPEKIDLLDKAVRLAASAPEDNVIRKNTKAVEAALLDKGTDPETARLAAEARVFGPAPGAFGVGMAGVVESSRDNNDQKLLAEIYLRNLGYVYSRQLRGKLVEGNLGAQLSNNEVVIHSRSTNLYGVLDNDDTFQFAGGLHAATTLASGKPPEFLISNVRKPGQERFEKLSAFLERELYSRAWNPKWIEGMKASGYSGARQIAREVEHLYGMRATAPEQVDPRVWQEMLEVYFKDKHRLGLKDFFEKENPYAQQMLAARLMEIDRQGVYKFPEADRKLLLSTYISSIRRHKSACYVNVCDNTALTAYVRREARRLAAVKLSDLDQMNRQLAASAGHPTPAEDNPKMMAGNRATILPRMPRPLFDRIVPADVARRILRHSLDRPIETGAAAVLLCTLLLGTAHGLARRRMVRPGLVVLASIRE